MGRLVEAVAVVAVSATIITERPLSTLTLEVVVASLSALLLAASSALLACPIPMAVNMVMGEELS